MAKPIEILFINFETDYYEERIKQWPDDNEDEAE